MKSDVHHKPVMLTEVLEGFKDMHMKVFFDGTVGAGGHANAILEAHREIELYIACDRDPSALKISEETLKSHRAKIKFVHSNHANIEQILKELSVAGVDGFFLT